MIGIALKNKDELFNSYIQSNNEVGDFIMVTTRSFCW